ncbi:MAG: helix-hairpin-helix domain-containing protein [Bacteroidales bacterium]|nr:helix-hairpin-helix domain-containing protein [Bacteroidales bacterium]
MRRLIFLAVISAVFMPHAFAQDYLDAVLFLTGASAPEELDADVLERFDALASRPVRINTATESRLVASGLFSRYQAASIADYRRSSGDILSVAELALLDGFGEAAARAMAPFVSFGTQAPPGRSSLEKGRAETEVMARSAMQVQEGESTGSHALKVRTGDEDRWLLSLAAKQASLKPVWPPASLSASAVIHGRKRHVKLILGDFNTRFGQGLLLWSGFSLSGVQSAAAMDRHPAGLSSAWTLSPDAAHRGAAADMAFGRFVLSGFWSYGKCSGANLTWLARNGQLGATAIIKGLNTRCSFDYRWSFGKIDLFGEAAADLPNHTAAFVAGGAWNIAYQVRLAASVRSYPAAFDGSLAGALRSSTRTADERGAALAFDCKKLTVTADAALHPEKGTAQYKSILKYAPQLTENLSLSFRAVGRYRPADPYPWRGEIRAEAAIASGSGLSLKGSGTLCHNAETSWLTYVEGGYLNESSRRKLTLYLRGTAFKIDRWDDRIYIYERDIPGAFSVPAYYGRGCSASAVASVKRRYFSLHARTYFTAYPGMAGQKPYRAGLKLQCQFTF